MILDGTLLTLLALTGIPVALLTVEVAAAWLPRSPVSLRHVDRPPLAVLIPAHNEAVGLLPTLHSVASQLEATDRLLVVADNCTDDAARIALATGAEVIERHNPSLRGKGYALDFGIEHLAQNLQGEGPELVIVVDADCFVSAGAIDHIARFSKLSGTPVQAMYLMKRATATGHSGSLAEFAWIIKNHVRALGMSNLGFPCNLMGTGMGLPLAAARSIPLASGHIVEDLTMGIDFALAGKPPLYCPEALVYSHFPTSEEGVDTQRKRWEHGHLSVIVDQAPRLLFAGLKRRQADLFMLGLDICVPPLALLALLVGVLTGLSAVNAFLTSSLMPLYLSSMLLAAFALAIGMSWWRFGRNVIAPGDLLRVAGYVLRKIPLYFTFLFRRQKQWVRSKRDGS